MGQGTWSRLSYDRNVLALVFLEQLFCGRHLISRENPPFLGAGNPGAVVPDWVTEGLDKYIKR